MDNFSQLNQRLIRVFGAGIDEADFKKLSDNEKQSCLTIFSNFLKEFEQNGHDETAFKRLLKDFPWV